MKVLTLEIIKSMPINKIIELYREGYMLEENYGQYPYSLSEIYNLGNYITEKIAIVIPIHAKSEKTEIIQTTLDGIQQTIGVKDYTISLVGTLPDGFDIDKFLSLENTKFIKTDLMLGDAKNLGAYSTIVNDRPDVIVFCDAHLNFFTDGELNSKDWGKIIGKYLSDHPNHIVAPAISLYDKPYQRGYGVISEVTDENIAYDLKWKWVGNPNINSELDSNGDYLPFEVAGLCGCFMSMSPWTFLDTMGYTPPLAIDDREFSIRAWTLGKTLACIPKLTVGHRFSSGYSDFSEQRSIQWGMGHLLYIYLNMDDESLEKLFKKGIHATKNKDEAMRLTKSNYWRNMKLSLQTRRVRTFQEYFMYFKNAENMKMTIR